MTLEEILQKDIIAICITHGHGDHIGDTSAIIAQKQVPIICEYGVANYFEEVEKYEHCLYGSIGGTVNIDDDISVKFFAATHG